MNGAIRLRHLAQINPSTPGFDKLNPNDNVTFLPMESVWPGDKLDKSQLRPKAAVSTGYTRFQDHDVLVPKITPTFEARRAVLIDDLHNGAGAGTTELHVLRAGPHLDSRYLFYLVNTHGFLNYGEAEMLGVAGQQRVPDDFLRNLPVNLPPLDEQRRIADFLDAETARIDRIVTARRRQTEKLTEKVSATISDTLAPGCLDSALGEWPWLWLPELPESWPLVRLGYVARLQNGLTVDSMRNLDRAVTTRPYLRAANVQSGYLALESITEITVPVSVAARSELRTGDVLMTEGGDLDKLGRGTVWYGQLDGCLHQNHVFAVRPDPKRLAPEYLALATRSLHGRSYFESTGVKTTNLASTTSNKILSFPIPLPSIDQQHRIAHYLKKQIANIERVQAAIIRQVDLLEERRQSLITSAVTGELDVTTSGGVRPA